MRFLFHGRTDTEWDEFDGFKKRYVICLWDGEICIKNKKTDRKITPQETKTETKYFILIDDNNKRRKLTDETIYKMQFSGKPMKPLTYLL